MYRLLSLNVRLRFNVPFDFAFGNPFTGYQAI